MASYAQNAETTDRRLKHLKYMRRGKKAAITKRIAQLETFVNEGSKKRMLQILVDGLQTVQTELISVCDEITERTSDDDEYNNLEDVRSNVEVCVAMVTAHLESSTLWVNMK